MPTLLLYCCITVIALYSQGDAKAVASSQQSAVDSAAKLQKQVESFSPFTGKWSCEGIFPKSGKHIASHIILAPDLEGAWLTVRHDDMPPDRFHALELWGFDSAAKNFVAYIYDNFGGVRKFTSTGLANDQLIWKGEGTKADPSITERFVFNLKDPSQFVVNYEVQRDSADWVIGDTLTCKK
ncbi:MAG TPA: hypothetical protein VN884_05515 [Candidatus Sulfotelmatobacter sp.]|nr:hypothetical protein [Candidatus Sulfotelmatobacter sp.]